MAGFNYGYNPYGVNGPSMAPVPAYYQNSYAAQNSMQPVFVHGRAGAEAYQMPPGVTKQTLWDDEDNRFYVKALDEMGRPKIVADNDYAPHVEPVVEKPMEGSKLDLSDYPTKKDLEDFLNKINTSQYLTRADLDKALSELTLGRKDGAEK